MSLLFCFPPQKLIEETGDQMNSMPRTIDTLNERLGNMQETLDRMERQQSIAEQKTSEKAVVG